MFSFLNSKIREAVGVDERRREERVASTAEVTLVMETPQMFEVRARMLDQSKSGFRASHMYPALTSGQVIRCRVGGEERLARVVWNRIIEEGVETGFLLL